MLPQALADAKDDLEKAAEFFRQGDDFVLTAHLNSDGDAIGSCLGLRRLLQGMGKRAQVVLPDRHEQYAFMADFDAIRLPEETAVLKDAPVAVLDCPVLERIGSVRPKLDPQAPVLKMDHHPGGEAFGQINLATTAVSSTSELVYHLATVLDVQPDAQTAEQLYTGILFDTGGFRYSLATPTTFEVAAQLVRYGARFPWINERLFGDKNPGSLKLLGRALDSLALHCQGRVAIMHLDPQDLRLGIPEDVVNHGLSLAGVQASVLLKEEEAGKFRLSLRSRAPIDVGAAARRFGGGGHAQAAGADATGDLASVRQAVLDAIAAYLS
jgi:bifunctional oligoribonuclease and PAP phosphatase NrnA